MPNQINGVRFDPSYYYDSRDEIQEMAENLIIRWKNAGINTVYYKAYDPIYGAKYRTGYDLNVMADYGKQDLLKHILKSAKRHDLAIIAWIPAFLHKSAWDQHPEWRSKNVDGSDYKPTPDSYYLCAANPHVRAWWLGFVKDILQRYDALAGIDIGEPIIHWNGHQCACAECATSEDRLHSSKGLTRTLTATSELVHKYDKILSITSVISPTENGRIHAPQEQRLKTGFDLNAVLDSPHKPDWMNLELMWQQWAELHDDSTTFNLNWLAYAAAEIIRQVNARSRVIGHVEITSFGKMHVDAEKLARSIQILKDAGIEHIDIYDTSIMDQQNAWHLLPDVLSFVKTKRVAVITDPRGENDAKQVASLLSHFKTETNFYWLDDLTRDISFDSLDFIFYVGVDSRFRIPGAVLSKMKAFGGTICWLNYGIEQFLDSANYGFSFVAVRHDSAFPTVKYKEYSLPKMDPSYVEIRIDSARQVVAMTDGENERPYVIKDENLWYFADLPTAFVTEGGRSIVFSDLLHDILHEDHKPKKLALIRIEDIHPLTNSAALRAVGSYLSSENVPFSVATVPFYLDPESNTTATMRDRPEFIKLLKEMQKEGGTLVMHGSTHQYRGETTADYEFWDGMTGEPLFADSKEYVRQKMATGLSEFWQAGLYPLVWETPHYAASQLDYPVINHYFSTAYERRQTTDLHGSDQLLPYLIYEHTSGSKIIPENLGYIPLTHPDPQPLIRAAENNLAIRDGVASFFYHTFVDHNVIKTIIPALKKMGYSFTSPRYTQNKASSPYFTAMSGSDSLILTPINQYVHEFYIDAQGRIKNESYSDSTISGAFRKYVDVPDGWIYIAEMREEKPGNLFQRMTQSLLPSVPRMRTTLFNSNKESLIDANAVPIRVAVVIDTAATGRPAVSQYNFLRSLSTVGIDAETVHVSNLLQVPDNINLLIVPQAAASRLNEQQKLFITYALQQGLNIVIEKHSSLAENIGIRLHDDKMVIHRVFDEYYPSVDMNWKEPDTLQAFDVDIEYVSYYSVAGSDEPVVIGGEYGEGKYLYFGTYFDPETAYGYGRFPYLVDLLQRQFDLAPTIRRHTVEIYFEPGDREDVSIEDLIKIWRNNGIRRIYVSGWHFYEEFTYDYERLIRLAHQNAMLVYIWLEIPHVSQKFWNEHPEWREVTASGSEAEIDWRKNMAVDIPQCRDRIMQELETILMQYQWDGINFAELYYESPLGVKEPSSFTPMNDYIRKLFKDEHHFDPKEIFNPSSSYYWEKNETAVMKFLDFRQDRIVELHRLFLHFLNELKERHGKEWEIMVTTLDNVFSPAVGRATGTNTMRILQLSEHYPFTIQI
ncbi:DUF2334 domain-containing protein, partial [candidate division KSB1 bacterium]|nr:DUF2334 domain-containing protein [candidate division KSB1 bacterium]